MTKNQFFKWVERVENSFKPLKLNAAFCFKDAADCNYFQFIQYGRTSKVQYVTSAHTITGTITDQNYILKTDTVTGKKLCYRISSL